MIHCVSCNPSGAPATSGAHFQTSIAPSQLLVSNLTEDGNAVFFQSTEGLVPADTAGGQDVYEWTAATGPELITTGENSNPQRFNELIGVTSDGHDVFFATSQALVPRTQTGVSVIYDARVGGGFPEPLPRCEGEACHGAPSATAPPATAPSTQFVGPGNPKPAAPCKARKKGKHGSKGRSQCQSSRHHSKKKGTHQKRSQHTGRKERSR
jgi:hypothetical protein